MSLEAKTWTISAPLAGGEGGFGSVFHVQDGEGNAAVVKLVDQDPGAERELLIGDSMRASQFRNVVPLLDQGEHHGQWALVMPEATESLEQYLSQRDGPIPLEEALQVLRDVATALSDLAGHVVHRDIKPGNVLNLEDAWCLSDFGIARYAEATTAPDTRKHYLSRGYAAPEQWNFKQATSATDVYSFGVLAYRLLAGRLPFRGPDYRGQHLTEVPEPLSVGPPRLRALIEECLFKVGEARPTPANILSRLTLDLSEPTSPGLEKLLQASQAQSAVLATKQAEANAQQESAQKRADMANVGVQLFNSVSAPLLAAVEHAAPQATIGRDEGHNTMVFVASLGTGRIGISRARESEEWNGPFTVYAHATIAVNRGPSRSGYQGRSHSLWYCDAQEEGVFHWFETAFMESVFVSASGSLQPFASSPKEAEIALSGVTGGMQLAWPFEEIDRVDPTEFVDRWCAWFADAANGELERPSTMPERTPWGSWRKG